VCRRSWQRRAAPRHTSRRSGSTAIHTAQVLPVEQSAAERAKTIVLGSRQLSARHALHLAIMQEHGIEQILSFDAGFDGFPGTTRLS
jgi:predicted nucleic acid-binding protein